LSQGLPHRVNQKVVERLEEIVAGRSPDDDVEHGADNARSELPEMLVELHSLVILGFGRTDSCGHGHGILLPFSLRNRGSDTVSWGYTKERATPYYTTA